MTTLKAARLKLGLTRRHVCTLTGIRSTRTLERYELGTRHPRPATQARLQAIIDRAKREKPDIEVIDI